MTRAFPLGSLKAEASPVDKIPDGLGAASAKVNGRLVALSDKRGGGTVRVLLCIHRKPLQHSREPGIL